MITTNINTTPPNYEEQINSFYLTQLDRTYDEGVVLSNSSSIGCRPLAFAIKAGTKILINGISLEIYSDAAQSAVEFFITATTLTESINKGSKITIDNENLFLQYQRKTEGQVAGFDIDADGISKGGIEITGWLNSDTLEGATINNLPTALSVKNYVDNSHPAEDQTLQEVTDRGNTTTNSIKITGGATEGGNSVQLVYNANYAQLQLKGTTGSFVNFSDGSTDFKGRILYINSNNSMRFVTNTSERMRITSTGNVGIGTTASDEKLQVNGILNIVANDSAYTAGYFTKIKSEWGVSPFIIESKYGDLIKAEDYGKSLSFHTGDPATSERMRITSAGNVGIGTTAPFSKLHASGTSTSPNLSSAVPTNVSAIFSNSDIQYGTMFATAGSGKGYIQQRRTNNATFYDLIIQPYGGNVGIGTTNPTSKLEVAGDTFIDGGLKVNAANIDFTGLGRTDPGVVGRLWIDEDTIKISAG